MFGAILLHALAVLGFDADRSSQTRSVDLAPGYVYALEGVRATGSGPFCLAVVEEAGPPSRTLYLACHAEGTFDAPLAGTSRVDGAPDRRYSVVAFRPTGASAATVVTTLNYTKVRRSP